MKRQLQIRIYHDGKIEGKTLGIPGKKCTDYIAVLERLLQARVIESAYTAEYDQAENQEQNETVAREQNVNGEARS